MSSDDAGSPSRAPRARRARRGAQLGERRERRELVAFVAFVAFVVSFTRVGTLAVIPRTETRGERALDDARTRG